MSSKNRLSWKNAWMQLHFYNRKYRIINGMDDSKWNCELTQHLWKKGWLQVLVQRNTVSSKILYYCKWPPGMMMVPLKYMAGSAPSKQQHALNRNICQIHCIIYMHFMIASALLKNRVSIEKWMAATTFVK